MDSKPASPVNPLDYFEFTSYQHLNQARFEFVRSLGLLQPGMRVLEVGAGPGDHTRFLLEVRCVVTATDGRKQLVDILKTRWPNVETAVYDISKPAPWLARSFDVVYCAGLLYHLANPSGAIATCAELASRFVLIDCCFSCPDAPPALNPFPEDSNNPSQTLQDFGCRPTRSWMKFELEKHFRFVYTTREQPKGRRDFPTDWSKPNEGSLSRAYFVASHEPLTQPGLVFGLSRFVGSE